ncbi:MAG: SIMPL domain-containing protein [Candidatus Aegiribacteria sp.]|nr:SIMPL domain-containing protein [Candidatus Aegiribacteria sp.]
MSSICIKASALLLIAVFFAGCGDSDEEYDYPGSINVTGSGTAYAEADVASIVFGVDITEKDPADAVNNAAEMMDAAFAAASEFGVEESDMMTTSYNMWVEDEYDYITYEYTGDTMYHLSHYAQVDVRDLDSVGEVLAALVGAGSNTISGVTFYVEDNGALKDEARSLAVADSRRMAEQLASELGLELGDATYVSEWIDYYPMNAVSTVCGDFASGVSAPSISPGAQSVTLSVQITFEMN